MARRLGRPLSELPPLAREKPYVLWGRNEMLLFALDEDYFFGLLTDGDGRTNPGGGRVFPGNPTTIMDSPLTRILGIPLFIDAVVPYDDFLLDLKLQHLQQLDLRVFGYDWRLSNAYNALQLRNFLYDQWGMDSPPEDERERVSIVAHSMGGLLARSFIESPQLRGHRFVKQLITVGTPHLGSPAAYNLMTDATPWGLLPIPEELLSRRRQQELSLRLDSLAEMLPVYDFVTRANAGGRREPWGDTLSELTLYRYPEFGRGPREEVDALSVVLAFRETLVPEEDLQAWLAWRRVRYLFLGGLGLLTAMETRERGPGGGRALVNQRPDGDGTVPYRSALGFGATRRRGPRDSPAAAETLRRGMTQHPPLHDTYWLARKAFDTDKRFPDALTNPERKHHQDALKIADVGAEITGRLDPNEATVPGPPGWEALVRVGHTLGTATRRHVRPKVVCAAVLRLRPGDGPPLAYVVRHCTPDQRPMLSMLQWPLRRECLADRLPQTFSDVYPGGDGARGTYPRRYLLLDRQVEARAAHMGGGAVLLDEYPAGDELFVVTWNTGEQNKSYNRHSNEHHAEAHLVGWLMSQDAAWRARVVSIDITVTFSPCPLCCGDLRDLTGGGRDADVKAATVAWRSLYRGNLGGGATDADALQRLTGGTPWEIVSRRVGAVDYPSPLP